MDKINVFDEGNFIQHLKYVLGITAVVTSCDVFKGFMFCGVDLHNNVENLSSCDIKWNIYYCMYYLL